MLGLESYAERDLSERVAKTVRGVKGVKNRMEVEYRTERSDSEISAEIEQRLSWDMRLDDELIAVQVDQGQVILSGSVGSAYERSLARENAWVAGVKSVDVEKLSVQWWSRDRMQRETAWSHLGDDKIKQAIEMALQHDPRVREFFPEVTVKHGFVTLSGVVDNAKARRAAAQTAANTIGVWRVKNFIKVRPVEPRPNDEIKMDIATALQRDDLVDRYDIMIHVDDGQVSLYGTVDSYFDKSQAEDIAAKTNGVTEINNYLTVVYDYPVRGYGHHDWDPTLYDYDFDYLRTSQSDEEIRQAILSELWWSPWVTYDEVQVTVDDGVATLTGTVDTWGERKSAMENAIEGGARKVINRLVVEY